MTAEQTTTLVIGSGFSALAMAAELDQQGIRAIVVDGSRPMMQHPSMGPTTGGISLAELSERSEIVRLLEHYARRHELDLRPETRALELTCTHQPMSIQPTSMENRWQVQTASGTLSAHSVVFTRSALSQLRRVLRSVGVTTAADVRAGMNALGLYLVGVGDLALPTTQEILHQARRAGQSISARLAAGEPGTTPALA